LQGGDFAVLELGSHWKVEDWATHIAQALHTHGAAIREMHRGGANVVLFVESASESSVRFQAELLRVLADADITLEHYAHANA
jgi:hypothetical protein